MTSSRKKKDAAVCQEETAFIGVRIPKELHRRIYRAKASLELSTGKFYGMGRLIERVLRRGISQIERETSGDLQPESYSSCT